MKARTYNRLSLAIPTLAILLLLIAALVRH